MIDAIGSVLPPALRPKLTKPPESPQTQFQVIEQVSDIQVASQRAMNLLSRLGANKSVEEPKKETAAEDDLPEVVVSRGKEVDLFT